MNSSSRLARSKRIPVLGAFAIVAVLAGLLALQLSSRYGAAERLQPPDAMLPAPRATPPLQELEVPCWACSEADAWSLRFRTDLDLLAPLGTGPGNAAEWFAQFRKPDGERYAEAAATMARRLQGPPHLKQVLPPDDPLLLEAEPWCDQATMRFYPEVLPFEGLWTALPNLLVPLTFARSWVARGLAATDPERSLADFRRAIRLGRLLRQDDTTVIADLIGLECIRAGAEGLFTVATRNHDAEQALLASLVLGEVAPQRLFSAERATRVELEPFASLAPDGSLLVQPPASLVDDAEGIARSDPDRRFRCQAMTTLGVIRFFGPPDQQQRVTAVLAELASDPDPGVAACAHWSSDPRPPEEVIKSWYGLAGEG